MTHERTILLVALAVLVSLSGCSGTDSAPETTARSPTTVSPTTDSGPEATTASTETTARTTATPSEERRIRVIGGTLRIDPDRQFERIENLTGYEATPPERIDIQDPDELRDFDRELTPFQQRLGFPEAEFTVSAYAWEDRIVLNASIGAVDMETTLAHEFYHVLYFQQDVNFSGDPETWTSEQQFVYRAITEGTADYVQQRYWETYVKSDGEDPAAATRDTYLNGSPTERQLRAAYHFGYRYVEGRIDSPRNLSEIRRSPPRTAEELVHVLPPGSEPPTPLSVSAAPGSDWRHRTSRYPDTKGELFVRHALGVGVDDETAIRGADGWGNDTIRAFERGADYEKGYVWTIRFDDAANASEFERAFDVYLSNRGERRGSVWATNGSTGNTVAFRVAEVDPETVSVIIGPRGFAANSTVTKDGELVVVKPP